MKIVQTLKKWFEAASIHGHHASEGIHKEPHPIHEERRTKSQKKKAHPKQKGR